MFQFIPQCVAGIGEVPGSSLYEEAILYLPMKQKSVEYFILPVLRNPGILSNSIKIFSLIVRCFIVRVPKYIFMFQISNLKYAINIKYGGGGVDVYISICNFKYQIIFVIPYVVLFQSIYQLGIFLVKAVEVSSQNYKFCVILASFDHK